VDFQRRRSSADGAGNHLASGFDSFFNDIARVRSQGAREKIDCSCEQRKYEIRVHLPV